MPEGRPGHWLIGGDFQACGPPLVGENSCQPTPAVCIFARWGLWCPSRLEVSNLRPDQGVSHDPIVCACGPGSVGRRHQSVGCPCRRAGRRPGARRQDQLLPRRAAACCRPTARAAISRPSRWASYVMTSMRAARQRWRERNRGHRARQAGRKLPDRADHAGRRPGGDAQGQARRLHEQEIETHPPVDCRRGRRRHAGFGARHDRRRASAQVRRARRC